MTGWRCWMCSGLLVLTAGARGGTSPGPLWQAVIDGDVERVGDLLDQDADTDVANAFGATPLMQAARAGSGPIIRLLLDRGADVNASTPRGWTALMGAVWSGHEECVAMLLAAGADVHVAARGRSRAPLVAAADTGQDAIIRLLLAHHADVDVRDAAGRTALAAAAARGHTRIVERLAEAGATVDAPDAERSTALVHAVAGGHLTTAVLLVELGADVNHRNRRGATPMSIAQAARDADLIAAVTTGSADLDAVGPDGASMLMRAIKDRNDPAAERLILAGADVNLPDRDGVTALMLATMRGRHRLVEMLLDHGSDVNAVSQRHTTAVEHAARHARDVTLLRALIDRGADLDLKAGNSTAGRRALVAAIRSDNPDAMRFLLEQGVDPNESGQARQSPLFIAANERREGTIPLLLDHGASLEVFERLSEAPLPTQREALVAELVNRARRRWAPIEGRFRSPWVLHRLLVNACEAGRAAEVQLLLEQGALPRAREAWPPIVLAAMGGHDPVIALLLASDDPAGSGDSLRAVTAPRMEAVDAMGPGGWTALMMAADRGHASTVKLLLEHGAAVGRENAWGRTALDLAEENGHGDVVGVLRRARGPRNDAPWLIEAVRLLDAGPFADLLDGVPDVNVVDGIGWSPLIHAVRLGRVAHVAALLARGADVQGRAGAFLTPLECALAGHTVIVADHRHRVSEFMRRDLIRHGAGRTVFGPLTNQLEIVRLLLQHGALSNVDAEGRDRTRRSLESVGDQRVREIVLTALNESAAGP